VHVEKPLKFLIASTKRACKGGAHSCQNQVLQAQGAPQSTEVPSVAHTLPTHSTNILSYHFGKNAQGIKFTSYTQNFTAL
jgi:hypothetical protein